ncbi:unnamed protein product [Protopolystoma xenopodis]|uniref:Uncharacterized protein n=1 Tax=Protopolystoma xenopodis TaxID=117903 RepID=A0A3S5BXA1_9PLAT|nr:unnamed protein product [Protopolystoma xenopodis]
MRSLLSTFYGTDLCQATYCLFFKSLAAAAQAIGFGGPIPSLGVFSHKRTMIQLFLINIKHTATEFEAIMNRISELERIFEKKDASRSKLKDELAMLYRELEVQKQKMEQVETLYKQAEDELLATESRSASLSEKASIIFTSSAMNQRVSKSPEKLPKAISQAKDELQKLESSIKTLYEQQAKHNQRLKDLDTIEATVENKLKALIARAYELCDRHTSLLSSIQELRENNTQTSVRAHSDASTEAEKKLETLKDKIVRLELYIDTATSSLKETELRLEEQRNRYSEVSCHDSSLAE